MSKWKQQKTLLNKHKTWIMLIVQKLKTFKEMQKNKQKKKLKQNMME